MNPQSPKPIIIVIEGIDGNGKQTQTSLLKNYLLTKNIPVTSQSFPNYSSDSSGPVKMYLGGQLSSSANEIKAYQSSVLFAVDRFCTIKLLFQQPFQENSILIFDRYVSSNMLHQGGKIEDTNELETFLNWLDDLEYNIMCLPRPDITIFLDMPPQASIALAAQRKELKTGTKEDIHEKDSSHLIHAYNTGKYIANKYKWDIINCVNEKNELRSEEEIHKDIINLIRNKVSFI